MKSNKATIDLIKSFEGFSNVAYKCPAGIWTIGYGFTDKVQEGDKITKEDAERRLKVELLKFESCVTECCHADLNENEFGALVSFCYNLGGNALRNSTMLKMLNKGMDRLEVSKQFLRWNKVGGKVLAGLTRRREAERGLFLKA